MVHMIHMVQIWCKYPKKPPEKKKVLTSTAKVSTTAVAARECLRALARANASHVLPVVLEARF